MRPTPPCVVWPLSAHRNLLSFSSGHTELFLPPSRLFLTSGSRTSYHMLRKAGCPTPPYSQSPIYIPSWRSAYSLLYVCVIIHCRLSLNFKGLEGFAHYFPTSSMGPVIQQVLKEYVLTSQALAEEVSVQLSVDVRTGFIPRSPPSLRLDDSLLLCVSSRPPPQTFQHLDEPTGVYILENL